MLLRKRVKNLEADMDNSFNNVKIDVDSIINKIQHDNRQHDVLSKDFYELRNELATNGVIRDIRRLQKDVEFLFEFRDEVLQFQHNLGHNGVATAINKLNKEVFKTRKDEEATSNFVLDFFRGFDGTATRPQEATLAGKVDAIIEHLGLDVSVKAEEVTPAKVVAKKVVTKKKGRR